jgi:hypothetical protein
VAIAALPERIVLACFGSRFLPSLLA